VWSDEGGALLLQNVELLTEAVPSLKMLPLTRREEESWLSKKLLLLLPPKSAAETGLEALWEFRASFRGGSGDCSLSPLVLELLCSCGCSVNSPSWTCVEKGVQ